MISVRIVISEVRVKVNYCQRQRISGSLISESEIKRLDNIGKWDIGKKFIWDIPNCNNTVLWYNSHTSIVDCTLVLMISLMAESNSTELL